MVLFHIWNIRKIQKIRIEARFFHVGNIRLDDYSFVLETKLKLQFSHSIGMAFVQQAKPISCPEQCVRKQTKPISCPDQCLPKQTRLPSPTCQLGYPLRNLLRLREHCRFTLKLQKRYSKQINTKP